MCLLMIFIVVLAIVLIAVRPRDSSRALGGIVADALAQVLA